MHHPRMVCDVAIIGGGLAGLTLAIALGQSGLVVAVIDREDPATAAADAFDGRGSAIALGSARVLRGLDLWRDLAPHAAAINDIRISDGDAPLFLHYDHRDVGTDPFGWIIENRWTRRALHRRLGELSTVTLIAPARGRLIAADAHGVRVAADGRDIAARVLIACDGRDSPVRQQIGVACARWDYNQAGIVTAIAHERPHGGTAFEHFLPAGPFAVLPLPDHDGRHMSSIVWTERAELAPTMMALPNEDFAGEIESRFGRGLGRITADQRRWSYPLSLMIADRYVDRRVALVGDAAHVIHPIAGQGLNLGLRDIAALAEVMVDAARLGLDIGGPDVLEAYAARRRFDNLLLAGVTDGLTRLFSNDVPPVRWARDFGLAMVQEMPPLKRFFMRHAMGLVGDPPRLARGEAL